VEPDAASSNLVTHPMRRWQSGQLHWAVNPTLRLRWFESITAHMIKIVRAVQTAIACPTQWDLWDDKDNYYYARYRHGCGELTQYKTENWVGAPSKPEEEIDQTIPGWIKRANTEFIRKVADFEYGDGLDGFIDLEKFAELAGIQLADDLVNTSFGEHFRDQLVTEAGMTFLLEDHEES
jgi:hypothetical protein